MASDIPPDRGGRAKARTSAANGTVKRRGAEGGGSSRVRPKAGLVRKMRRLHGPLDRLGRCCHGGGNKHVVRNGPPRRVRSHPTGQAIVSGIDGDGRRLAPCQRHRTRPPKPGCGSRIRPPNYSPDSHEPCCRNQLKSWAVTWWREPALRRVRSWNSMLSLPESSERRRATAGPPLLQRQERRCQAFRLIGKVHFLMRPRN